MASLRTALEKEARTARGILIPHPSVGERRSAKLGTPAVVASHRPPDGATAEENGSTMDARGVTTCARG